MSYLFCLSVRTCFVSDLQRGLKIQEAKFNLEGTAEVGGSRKQSWTFK